MFSSRSPAGRQERVAHGDHAGKIEVIDLAGAVVAAAARVVQSAAEVDDRRVRMLAQIVPHLPCKVVLAHGGLQKAELLHETLGLLGQK